MLEYILQKAASLDEIPLSAQMLQIQVRDGTEAPEDARQRKLKEIFSVVKAELLEHSVFFEIPDDDRFISAWRAETLDRAKKFSEKLSKPIEEILLMLYGIPLAGDIPAALTKEAKKEVQFAAIAEYYVAGQVSAEGEQEWNILQQYAEDFYNQIIVPQYRDKIKVELLPAIDVSVIKDIDEVVFTQDVLPDRGPMVVDCYTPWCGNCKLLLPVLAELAGEMPEWRFFKMDVNACSAIGDRYEVDLVPTLLVFQSGKLLGSLVGTDDARTLRGKLEALLEKAEQTEQNEE